MTEPHPFGPLAPFLRIVALWSLAPRESSLPGVNVTIAAVGVRATCADCPTKKTCASRGWCQYGRSMKPQPAAFNCCCDCPDHQQCADLGRCTYGYDLLTAGQAEPPTTREALRRLVGNMTVNLGAVPAAPGEC